MGYYKIKYKKCPKCNILMKITRIEGKWLCKKCNHTEDREED